MLSSWLPPIYSNSAICVAQHHFQGPTYLVIDWGNTEPDPLIVSLARVRYEQEINPLLHPKKFVLALFAELDRVSKLEVK